MPFIEGNDVKIYFEEYGKGETLIFLHSLGTSRKIWDRQIEFFKDRFHIIAIDARGHGNTGFSPPFDFKDCAEDIIRIMDLCSVKRAHIIGISMGGYTAFQLYSIIPERIASVALCNTLYEFTAQMREKLMASRLELVDQPEFVLKWALSSHQPTAPRELIEETMQLYGCSNKVYKHWWVAINHIDYSAVLQSIAVPTLILTGGMDKIASVEIAKDMHEQIRGSELVIIKPAGHLSNLSHPGIFNQTIAVFLSKLTEGGGRGATGNLIDQ